MKTIFTSLMAILISLSLVSTSFAIVSKPNPSVGAPSVGPTNDQKKSIQRCVEKKVKKCVKRKLTNGSPNATNCMAKSGLKKVDGFIDDLFSQQVVNSNAPKCVQRRINDCTDQGDKIVVGTGAKYYCSSGKYVQSCMDKEGLTKSCS